MGTETVGQVSEYHGDLIILIYQSQGMYINLISCWLASPGTRRGGVGVGERLGGLMGVEMVDESLR